MKLTDPIIIIGAPRSGTTFLKELLTFQDDLWHLPSESHHILEGPLHPDNFSEYSNRPDEGFMLSNSQIEQLRHQFREQAVNISNVPGGQNLLDRFRGNRFARKGLLNTLGPLSKIYKPAEAGIRFIEKTPKNIVRIPAICQIFPDAKYIYLTRKPVDNISSIYRGWNTETNIIYKLIKGHPRFAGSEYQIDMLNEVGISDNYWRFVLPPGWREQKFRDLMDIAIYQWQKSNELAEQDLTDLIQADRVFRIEYAALVKHTKDKIDELLDFADLSRNGYSYQSLQRMPKINQSGNKKTAAIDNEEIKRRLSGVV
jgi:hypothetical protein